MSFILRSHQDRYRQRSRENFYRMVALFAILFATLMLGYAIGSRKNAQDTRQMERQNLTLQQQTEMTEEVKTDLQAKYQTLSIQYQQLADRYKRDMPQGELAPLVALLKDQLAKGMDAKRLAQVLRSSQPPQNCSDTVNKRFILSTAIYKGPQSAVTFADGAITVSGTGEASVNNKRNKEAWFDPGKPVTIQFQIIGGKKEEKTGLLPVHHSIIVQNREYRFTITEGPRSFIGISSDSCDYPESAPPAITPIVSPLPETTPANASAAQ